MPHPGFEIRQQQTCANKIFPIAVDSCPLQVCLGEKNLVACPLSFRGCTFRIVSRLGEAPQFTQNARIVVKQNWRHGVFRLVCPADVDRAAISFFRFQLPAGVAKYQRPVVEEFDCLLRLVVTETGHESVRPLKHREGLRELARIPIDTSQVLQDVQLFKVGSGGRRLECMLGCSRPRNRFG